MMELKIDFHVHSDLSPDGRSDLPALLRAARERGLDAIALTDHNVFSSPQDGAPFVMPGCECSTREGHILALFLTGLPGFPPPAGAPLPGAVEVIEAIHAAGGLAVVAHPFERLPGVADEVAAHADAIEGCNARACFRNAQANAQALQLAGRLGKPRLGGSDAHSAAEIGNACTLLRCDDASPEALRRAILTGGAQPLLQKKTRRVYKGLSQLKKCRRSKPGPVRLLKALDYLMYCWTLDLRKD